MKERKENIQTVLEVGCGFFEYYSHFFRSLGMQYTGLDINRDIIDFRKSINPEQEFIYANIFDYSTPRRYDLVCHHMVLSGLIGMEKNLYLLKRTVKLSNKYGFGVFWNTSNVDEELLKSCLINEGLKNVCVFWEPTGLHTEQPQRQLILHWEK